MAYPESPNPTADAVERFFKASKQEQDRIIKAASPEKVKINPFLNCLPEIALLSLASYIFLRSLFPTKHKSARGFRF